MVHAGNIHIHQACGGQSMTHMLEPRRAADEDSVASSGTVQDGELTTLIRRWMAAGGKMQDRRRRETILRVAPEPAVEPGRAEPDRTEPEAVAPTGVYVVGTTLTPVSETHGLIEGAPQVDVPNPEPTELPAFPRLPQRATGAEAGQVHRVALLIDARRVTADVATGLLQLLGERGTVNVCRAYADWDRADRADWIGQMRREGLHSFHHFSDDDDQALVAMAIDAVDIARDAAVDEVVIAGDLTSALPLVHRLHAAGVRVVAVGSGHTPHDVRAACHEFIDSSTIDGTPVVQAGRHRA
jgi:hypothetical protein